MAKPATTSLTKDRRQLFQHIATIVQDGTEVSKKNRAAIKKAIISFIRKSPSDSFLMKLSDLPGEMLQALCTQVSQAGDLDLKSLVQQVMNGAEKEKVLKKEHVPDHVLKRQWMDIFLSENKDWKDISLSDLLSRSYTLAKNSKMETEDNLIVVSMILEALYKRPPLPIPSHTLHSFLETSDFIPNTEGDVDRFIRQHGLDLLVNRIQEETCIGKSKEEIRKSISGLLSDMSIKDRRYVKVRFLTMDQVVQMIEVYRTKPVELFMIINQWVQGRYTKILGETKGVILKQQKKQSEKNDIEYVSFIDSTPRPLLYIMLRPWVKDMKTFLVSSDNKEYLYEWVKESWYTPSKRFYEDSTDPNTVQKGDVCIIKGSRVRILYQCYSGKEYVQDEATFQLEVLFFKNYPGYSIPFLEKATRSVSLANLSNQYLDSLKHMGLSILISAFSQRLSTTYFDVEQMAEDVLTSVLDKSHYMIDFFEYLFMVAHRLDPAVSNLSDLHRVFHQRLERFFYPLSQLPVLTDGLAFPEISHLTAKQKSIVSSCYKSSKEYFLKKQLYHFQINLFPLQKISGTLPFPDWKCDVPYPAVPDDLFYKYWLSTDVPLDLRTVANIYMNDANVESNLEELKETSLFFSLDYVYYRDDIDSGLFIEYPQYYKPESPEIAQETAHEVMTESFPDFWVRFDVYLKDQEALSIGKGKIIEPIVQELLEVEEEDQDIGDEEEQEAGEMEEYPDFPQQEEEEAI